MSNSNTERNKEIVKAFLESFSTQDSEKVLSFVRDDVDWWVSGTLPGLSGSNTKAQMRELLKPMSTMYRPGTMRVTPTGFTAEGDRVAVEANSYAELFNGKTYRNTYHFLFVLQDGKLKQIKEYIDTHHAYEIFLAP